MKTEIRINKDGTFDKRSLARVEAINTIEKELAVFDSKHLNERMDTASASEDDQRCRLIIPLDREVNEKEYRIITSMIMADISPDDIRREKSEREFDWSCNETNRAIHLFK